MQEIHITSTAALEALCERIRTSSWLALDTEFMREKNYYPRFCLLQLSDGEVAATVDPLAVDDLAPLLEILYDGRITKIFHAARQDLEIFHHLWGRIPTPLFDTQLAANLLGMGDQIGYGALVQKLLGRELEKGHSRTDWEKRPLHPSQLRYALDDVIYLGEIYRSLHRQLQEGGRESWLADDFALLADAATYEVNPATAWQRIKGRQVLKGVRLAVLGRLAQWREETARRTDRPRRWILKDEVLVDLSRRLPGSIGELERIRGLERGTIQRQGETLLQLIGEARALPREEWPREEGLPPRLTANQEAMADLLMCSLRLLAEEQRITHTALAGRKELERLAAGERDLDILRGWRRNLAGDRLLAVIEGRVLPMPVNGRLTLQPLP